MGIYFIDQSDIQTGEVSCTVTILLKDKVSGVRGMYLCKQLYWGVVLIISLSNSIQKKPYQPFWTCHGNLSPPTPYPSLNSDFNVEF